MSARRLLWPTRPYYIDFVLGRAKEDSLRKPCLFRWSLDTDAFSPAGFILLHHTTSTPDGFEVVEVDHTGLEKHPEEDAMIINGRNQVGLRQLEPGVESRFMEKLPERYYAVLKDGETYTLLYPGAEVAMWDWGTRQTHLSRELKARHLVPPTEDDILPALMIPGGAHVTFTVRAQEPAWSAQDEERRKSLRVMEGCTLKSLQIHSVNILRRSWSDAFQRLAEHRFPHLVRITVHRVRAEQGPTFFYPLRMRQATLRDCGGVFEFAVGMIAAKGRVMGVRFTGAPAETRRACRLWQREAATT